MAAYAQPGAKRQKVRERTDTVDFFQGIDRVEYNNSASLTESGSYRYFNAAERINSKSMEDWLKLSVSFTDFCNHGTEIQTRPPQNRPWDDSSNSLESHKRCLKACFDLMTKLGVKYWTAFDTDIVPWSDSWEEYKTNWDEMTDYIHDLGQKYHVKLLWLAPDLHSHVRYTTGAFTNPEAHSFIQAATQIKKCLEVSQRLSAECFLLWPRKEGYTNLFQTDVQRELKLFAKLLKLTAEYKEKLNFRCQLLIMPYYNCNSTNSWNYSCNSQCDDRVNRYMWDVTSCLYFLKNYNLDRYYKVCSVPGHHMVMASIYHMLGGITITNDFNRSNNKIITVIMKCILDQGSPPPSGITLQLTSQRDSDLRDLVTLYVKYIDTLARGLRVVCGIQAEQTFTKHLQQRYMSYYNGFGSRLASGDVSLEECEEYYKKNESVGVSCPKTEFFDLILQRYIDTCDHV